MRAANSRASQRTRETAVWPPRVCGKFTCSVFSSGGNFKIWNCRSRSPTRPSREVFLFLAGGAAGAVSTADQDSRQTFLCRCQAISRSPFSGLHSSHSEREGDPDFYLCTDAHCTVTSGGAVVADRLCELPESLSRLLAPISVEKRTGGPQT